MTDNPHYVTPDEAIKKYCVFPATNGPTHKACTGAACMAWRWTTNFEYDESTFKLEERFSKTHGYCGMVRS